MLSYAELDQARKVNTPIQTALWHHRDKGWNAPTTEQLAAFVAHVCHLTGFDIDRYTNGVSHLVLLFEAFDLQRQRVVPTKTASTSCLTVQQDQA